MNNNVFDKFTVFLDALERRGIGYSLAHYREEAMMIIVAVPGERWEIEFLSDGSVEVERFISNGEIYEEDILNGLFARYAGQENGSKETFQEAVLVNAAGN
jgi:hypothetical protein